MQMNETLVQLKKNADKFLCMFTANSDLSDIAELVSFSPPASESTM